MKTRKEIKSLYLFDAMPIIYNEPNRENILNISVIALGILGNIKANNCNAIFEFEVANRHDLSPKNIQAKAITYILNNKDIFFYDTVANKFVIYDPNTKLHMGFTANITSAHVSLVDILNPAYPSNDSKHESDLEKLLGFDRVAFENYDLFCQINTNK